MTSLFAPTSIYVTSVNDICKMKISLITTKILNICHHVVPRILLIMQHRKVKAWPLKFTGFWVKASFFEAEKEDSKMFLMKMWSRCFTSKKHIVCTFSCWDREPAFAIFQKKFKLFFCQELKQFCQMCRCFVWCLKNAASAVKYWVLRQCSIMCTYMRSSRVKHEFNVLSTKDKLHNFESSNQ